jgi:hypothetical protein
MKDPNYPTEQPKDPVADALTDRNADPDALTQESPLKVHGDALLHGTSAQHREKKDDVRRDDQR